MKQPQRHHRRRYRPVHSRGARRFAQDLGLVSYILHLIVAVGAVLPGAQVSIARSSSRW